VSVNGIEVISLCNGVCERNRMDLPENTGMVLVSEGVHDSCWIELICERFDSLDIIISEFM
jgi:hypothetical protein